MGHTPTRFWAKFTLTLIVGLGLWASLLAQQQPQLTWLPPLPGGDLCRAFGVSDNGSIVVGQSASRSGFRGVRWVNGAIEDLGSSPEMPSTTVAMGVSSTGDVIVGFSLFANSVRAFRWDNRTGTIQIQDLGGLAPDSFSRAFGVSADGEVVVGESTPAGVAFTAPFYWTQSSGMLPLPGLSGAPGERGAAWGASADGSVIVGGADDANRQRRPVLWNRSGNTIQVTDLGGNLPGQGTAFAVSRDGTVVVGTWNGRAARWRIQGGQVQMEILDPNITAVPRGVSADGRVVVGLAYFQGIPRAFRWVEGRGMEDLNITYAALLLPRAVLVEATAISPDGRYIVGYGANPTIGPKDKAFILDTIPEPASLAVLGSGLGWLLLKRRRRV